MSLRLLAVLSAVACVAACGEDETSTTPGGAGASGSAGISGGGGAAGGQGGAGAASGSGGSATGGTGATGGSSGVGGASGAAGVGGSSGAAGGGGTSGGAGSAGAPADPCEQLGPDPDGSHEWAAANPPVGTTITFTSYGQRVVFTVKNASDAAITLAPTISVGYQDGFGYGTVDNTCSPDLELGAGECCSFTVVKGGSPSQGPEQVSVLVSGDIDPASWPLEFDQN